MRKSPHIVEAVLYFWNSETALYNPEQTELNGDLMCPLRGMFHVGPGSAGA